MEKVKILSLILFIVAFTSFETTLSQLAPRCPVAGANETCALPDCRCSSAQIPGNLTRTQTPQIVFLSFDNAVTISNFPLYEELLFNRTNPNNASISASFFISHEYNDYSMTHQLYRRGHDISLNSITRFSNTQYWQSLNESMWAAEVVDQRNQMAQIANIPLDEIKGMRAPFLQIGGDSMYRALHNGNLTWECSRPTWNMRTPGIWPYTNDYLSTQDCQIAPCPTGQYKGFWTVPMIDLIGLDGFPCPMIDSCSPRPTTANDTLQLLRSNFLDQYNGNRAPFGVFTTAAWMIGDDEAAERKLGYRMFLDYLESLPDVYMVSISKGLEWIKRPVPLTQINTFVPWQAEAIKDNGCQFPISCRYTPVDPPSERYMTSCNGCPVNYPWIHNPLGD